MVSHFLHHNNHHQKIDFSQFITEHYSENQHDENHDEHENLPFHKLFDYSYNQTLALNLETVQFKLRANFNFKEPNKIAFKQNYFQSNVSINIWKPPKIS